MLAGIAMLGLAFGLFALTIGAVVLYRTQYEKSRLFAVLTLSAGVVCVVILWVLTFVAWSFGGS